MSISSPARDPTARDRLRAGVLAVLQHLHAVDETCANADRVCVGLLERGRVRDRRWIEDDDVGELAGLELTAASEAQFVDGSAASFRIASGRVSTCSSRTYFPEHAGEVAVGSRMRRRFQEHAFRGIESASDAKKPRAAGSPSSGCRPTS